MFKLFVISIAPEDRNRIDRLLDYLDGTTQAAIDQLTERLKKADDKLAEVVADLKEKH